MYFDFFSVIIFDSDSHIELGHGFSIKKSVIHLQHSELRLGKDATFSQARIMLTESKAIIGESCKISDILLTMSEQTEFSAGNYFLLKGPASFKSGFFLTNSAANLGYNVNIRAYVVCNDSTFQIGNNVFINGGTQVRCEQSISIGNNVFISYDCIIFDSNTHSVEASGRNKEIADGFPNDVKQLADTKAGIKKAPILIGDEVWIGTRAIIFKGTSLGNQVIVGAGAVISGLSVPHTCKVYGNPAIVK